jgi:hypothetical protein
LEPTGTEGPVTNFQAMRWTSSSSHFFMQTNGDRRQPKILEPWLLPWHSFVGISESTLTHGGTLVSSPICIQSQQKGCPLKKNGSLSSLLDWDIERGGQFTKEPPWWKSGSGIRSSLFELSCKWHLSWVIRRVMTTSVVARGDTRPAEYMRLHVLLTPCRWSHQNLWWIEPKLIHVVSQMCLNQKLNNKAVNIVASFLRQFGRNRPFEASWAIAKNICESFFPCTQLRMLSTTLVLSQPLGIFRAAGRHPSFQWSWVFHINQTIYDPLQPKECQRWISESHL